MIRMTKQFEAAATRGFPEGSPVVLDKKVNGRWTGTVNWDGIRVEVLPNKQTRIVLLAGKLEIGYFDSNAPMGVKDSITVQGGWFKGCSPLSFA